VASAVKTERSRIVVDEAYMTGGLTGNMVEMGTVERVLMEPKHSYTQIVRESNPDADPKKKRSTEVILSNIGHKEFLRESHRFAGRCPQVMDIRKGMVPLDLIVNDVLGRCFRYDENVSEVYDAK